MKLTDYPSNLRYRYIFNAIVYSSDDKALTAVGECIAKTVPPDHEEVPILVEFGKKRREELKAKVEARQETPDAN